MQPSPEKLGRSANYCCVLWEAFVAFDFKEKLVKLVKLVNLF
jgi:hypothetical protein